MVINVCVNNIQAGVYWPTARALSTSAGLEEGNESSPSAPSILPGPSNPPHSALLKLILGLLAVMVLGMGGLAAVVLRSSQPRPTRRVQRVQQASSSASV